MKICKVAGIKGRNKIKLFILKAKFKIAVSHEDVKELPPFQTLFFFILVPPIMLESAFALHEKVFINILSTVLLHAVIGTIINFLFVGGCLCLANNYRPDSWKDVDSQNLTSAEIFLFSSLISAVGKSRKNPPAYNIYIILEPGSVLEIFNTAGVSPQLYYLVKGESLINDGVSFVFYSMTDVFTKIEAAGHVVTAADITLGIVSFFTISLGGLAIGLILGSFSSWLSKGRFKKIPHISPRRRPSLG